MKERLFTLGMLKFTRTKSIPESATKIRKMKQPPIKPISDKNPSLTEKPAPQLTAVVAATAQPLMGLGKVSLNTVHVTGPICNSRHVMNRSKATQATTTSQGAIPPPAATAGATPGHQAACRRMLT